MQTRIDPRFQDDPTVHEADEILRSCVHCGFCTATCPTYQLFGDELDGPRGRIYLIKEFLAGAPVTHSTLTHLDRCLTCRACETTCPSGVRYARLAEIGREHIEAEISRPLGERLKRRALRAIIPHPRRFAALLRVGQACKPLLPKALARKVPERRWGSAWPVPQTSGRGRSMIALTGCVQGVVTPATHQALEAILARLDIRLQTAPAAGCCGALSLHLNAREEARDFMRRNIDAWWPLIAAGAEAIVVSASGCGSMVKEYGEALRDDPGYADKAARVAALARDPSEVLLAEDLDTLPLDAPKPLRIAFHAPCSLQHGQRLPGTVERLLQRAGYRLTAVPDGHLCCGSAGSYSLLQPIIAATLRDQKLAALNSGTPNVIATANIGCQMHLQSASPIPVRHWLELVADALPKVL